MGIKAIRFYQYYLEMSDPDPSLRLIIPHSIWGKSLFLDYKFSTVPPFTHPFLVARLNFL